MLGGWQQPSRKIDKDHNLTNESWNKPLFVDYFTRSCRCQRHSIYDANCAMINNERTTSRVGVDNAGGNSILVHSLPYKQY